MFFFSCLSFPKTHIQHCKNFTRCSFLNIYYWLYGYNSTLYHFVSLHFWGRFCISPSLRVGKVGKGLNAKKKSTVLANSNNISYVDTSLTTNDQDI